MPRKNIYTSRSEANRANVLKRWSKLTPAQRRVQMQPAIDGHTEESRAMAGTAGGWATARGMTKAERRERGQKGGEARGAAWAKLTAGERKKQAQVMRAGRAKKSNKAA
jgi:hypothetical protein